MDAISAITTVSSLLSGAKGLVNALRGSGEAKAGSVSANNGFSEDLQKAVAALIKSKDKNGDGVLSAQELGLNSQALKGLDRSGDGALDATELMQAMSGSKVRL